MVKNSGGAGANAALQGRIISDIIALAFENFLGEVKVLYNYA